MRLTKKRNSTTDEVRRVVLAALVAALQDAEDSKRKSGGLTGVRALATGAALYGAGRAIVGGRRLLQERSADGDEAEAQEDEDELYDEPESETETDEDEYDEEYEEPQAEGDQEADEEEDEEPQAEADEGEPEERPAPRRRRPRGSAPDQPSLDLPKRPSRSRSPVRS
jgi:hypothetical protein